MPGTRPGMTEASKRSSPMTVSIGHLQPIVALIAGVLILIMPRLLNYIVAIYLIIIGIMGLHLRRRQGRGQSRACATCSAARAPTSPRWPISACRCRPASPSPPRSAPISTPTARSYPKELKAQVEKALDPHRQAHRQGFGDPKNPLLVSVRSGARASMPGMMDTVLNLGLNDETVEALAKSPATALRL
jgi:hypothetical protein